MNYTLQNMTVDELMKFLALFSDDVLCKPIIKNPKQFQKHTSGFRPTNLPKHMLYKTYYDEIHSGKRNSLETFLIENSKLNFQDTKIEELVDSVDGSNLLSVAPELEKEILHAKLTISPKQVFLLAGYSVELQLGKMMDEYHIFFLEESKQIQEKCADELINEHNEKYSKLKSTYEEILNSFTIERDTVRDLKEIIKQKDTKIDARDSENLLLQEKLQKEIAGNGLLRQKSIDLEAENRQIKKLIREIVDLKRQIEELKSELAKAEGRALSPETVRELSIDVLEDLKANDIAEDAFLHEAESFFAADETLIESWTRLSSLEQEKLFAIVDKMKQNYIENADMDILDTIENMVQYKYMIMKGLKIIFFRYLEQKSGEKTIAQRFKYS